MARERGAAAERIWRERLARYRRCAETVADFCEREGVSTPTFYAWKRRLTGASADKGGAVKRSAPLFVPISVGAVAAGVRIVLPGGAVVELPPAVDERLLRTCIRAAAECDPDGEEHAC
jgi:hypothetical protein